MLARSDAKLIVFNLEIHLFSFSFHRLLGWFIALFHFPPHHSQTTNINERTEAKKKSQTYTNFSIISSNSFATLTFSIPFTHSLTHVFRISNADTFTYISTGKKSSTNEKNIRAISSIFFFASHFIRMLYFSCEYNPTIWVWVENAIRYIVWNRFKMAVHKSCSFRLFEMSLKLGKMCFWLGCRKGSKKKKQFTFTHTTNQSIPMNSVHWPVVVVSHLIENRLSVNRYAIWITSFHSGPFSW